MKSDAEKSVDLDDSFSDNLMQNPQSRLYEVCKQLISVTEDVCKLQMNMQNLFLKYLLNVGNQRP